VKHRDPAAATSDTSQRAALYMRVSTGRQAEHDLSIPDQRRQLEAWCRAHGYIVAMEFIESGASAGDDRRPVFQQMIERACDGEQAFELILVHSYSRFFREAFEQGAKIKKKLDVAPVEAETVQLIYKLYLEGDGNSGALGIKEVVKWLNRNGHRTRRGECFGVAPLHKILTNTVYIGQWKFNKTSSRTGQRKPDEEVVTIPVPGLIDRHVFDQVQRQLHARSPKVVAPRVTTGPILLTGLAVCATCKGGMTLRTGTSQNGIVHRYYTCSTCARKGKTACKGRSIRMDKLDGLVTGHLVEQLFNPERVAAILTSLTARRAAKAESVSNRIMALQSEVTDTEDKLKRLYRLVEDGLTDLDDVLKDRLNSLKADRDRAKAALEATKSQIALGQAELPGDLRWLDANLEGRANSVQLARRQMNDDGRLDPPHVRGFS
jgi:Recombinase/Resolvase, N terminal domain/Recombinase zinc beta ribbon domain